MKSKIIAIVLALVGTVGLCSPVNSMLGADGAEVNVEEWTPTALDYIQDGLVFHFDGIENSGYGQHSDSSIANLITGTNLSLSEFVNIENNCLAAEEPFQQWFFLDIPGSLFTSNQTIEAVFKTSDLSGNVQFVLLHLYWRRCVGIAGDAIGCGLRQKTAPSWYARGDLVSVSAAYEGTQNTSSAVFVNGIESATSQGSQFASPTGTGTSVGYAYKSPNIDAKGGFSGKIYSIRIYNRILTSAEVSWNYLIDRERFVP